MGQSCLIGSNGIAYVWWKPYSDRCQVIDSPERQHPQSVCFDVSSDATDEDEEDMLSCPGPDDSPPHRVAKVRDLRREQDELMEQLVRLVVSKCP